ncbi:serine hydrolase [Paenibacillus sp. sgz500992]|uniref:serine hydrolase n=1 Tax=Paenibacillus sp. sgz500992 TaxID=3242476 RepID=UPI0036D24ECC
MMKKILGLALATLLILPSTALAKAEPVQRSDAKLEEADVKEFTNQFFKQKEIQEQLVGAAVVVVKDGKVLLNQGYGYADVAAKKPFDADKTVFRLASVSKLLTSVGIMQLAEAGKVDLNKDIQGYLPHLQIPNKTGSPLTLKHLMTNTSGFDLGGSADPAKAYSLEEYVKATVPTVTRKPGEAYRYNNYGFSLLGYIIEQTSGSTFEEYMKKGLFEPLGMDNSNVLFNSEVKKAIATPYDITLKPAAQIPNIPDSGPEGGMFSTGSDMAKFLQAMVNYGQQGSKRILTKDSVLEMEKNSVTIHPDIPGSGYGLETIYPSSYNGYTVVEKGGDLPGFHSNLWLLPEEKTGIFIVFNSDKGNLRAPFFEQFMNRYFPGKGISPVIKTPKPTQEQLHPFEGLYRDLRMPGWTYNIKAGDGTLMVSDPRGEHVLRQSKDMLFYDEEGVPAGFKADKDGNMEYFSYNKEGSWSEKLPEPAKYSDVPEDHPYAKYIYELVQLGVIQQDQDTFKPEEPLARGKFIAQLFKFTDFPLSSTPSQFSDTKGHPYEAVIQTAVESGVVSGFSDGSFRPDEPVTREQAATIIWRLVKQNLMVEPVKAELSEDVSPWASEGVQFVVGLHLYGPDVATTNGTVQYRPKDMLLNQESAVLMGLLFQNLF